MNVTKDPVTTEEFDEALEKILDEQSGAALLAVPGVYEVVSEHYNNDVIDRVFALRRERTGK